MRPPSVCARSSSPDCVINQPHQPSLGGDLARLAGTAPEMVCAGEASRRGRVDADCNYDDSTGGYYNVRLDAPSVWCTDVPTSAISEAADIFERCELRAAYKRLDLNKSTSREEVQCRSGERFFAHHAGWHSDVAWISADDQPTHEMFLSIFEQMSIAQKFGPIIGDEDGSVHLYSAFFVVSHSFSDLASTSLSRHALQCCSCRCGPAVQSPTCTWTTPQKWELPRLR